MNAPLSRDRGYCGGANIAGILGLSPFRSPLDEYLTITGELPEDISPAKRKFFDRRKALEPFASECFTLATELPIYQRNKRYDDRVYPWAKAEIDAETVDKCGEVANIEFKSIHPNTAWQWGDPDEGEEPPLYVTAQVMWGLGVTERDKAYVHGLDLDSDRIYVVERDDEMIADIRMRAANFWKYHVEPRRMPSPSRLSDLNRLYTRDSGREVAADAATRLALEELVDTKRKLKLYESAKLVSEFKIKMFMKDATTLNFFGQTVATWKSRKDGKRVFRTP